jgi:deoxycytidine triphosphate deaminase
VGYLETGGAIRTKKSSLEQSLIHLDSDFTAPGFLSDVDIRNLLNKDIVICDFDEENLTDIGYNLTPTDFVFSINNGLLLEIHHNETEKYCYIEPHDTVLIITRESVWVSEKISGTFHSKVKLVSAGFGHVSTTLDPFWEGPLVISINNPTNKKLKFLIEQDRKDGGGYRHCSFVTLIFYKMVSSAEKTHDNKSCRLDILKNIVEKPDEKDESYYKYNELDNIIKNIAELDFVKYSIAELRDPSRRRDGIMNFKEKGKDFDRQINDYIQKAKSITDAIREKKKSKKDLKDRRNKMLTNISILLLIIPIIVIIYIAIRNRHNGSVNLGQILALFLSAYLSMIPQLIEHFYSKKEK